MRKATARAYIGAMKKIRMAINQLERETELMPDGEFEDLFSDLCYMRRELYTLSREMEHHEADALDALGIKEE